MYIKEQDSNIYISDFGKINLALTLDCGQAFRWTALPDGSFYGIAGKHEARVSSDGDRLVFHNTKRAEVEDFWLSYFDLFTDYETLLSELSEDSTLAYAIEKYGVIRILNQPPWETLCSFIISTCNNIPRIKSIVKRFSEGFGERLQNGSAFPDVETVAALDVAKLDFLRAGYRSPYIIDAARKVNTGIVNFDEIKKLPLDKARKKLTAVNGVGNKVADCTLLFSLGFNDAFPVDRHIERANERLYPNGLPSCFDGKRGLAQQYIFHVQRTE